MALAALAEHTHTQPAGIGKPMVWIMAASAGDPSIFGEASIKEQALPQRYLIQGHRREGRSHPRVRGERRVIALPAGEAEAHKRHQGRLQ